MSHDAWLQCCLDGCESCSPQTTYCYHQLLLLLASGSHCRWLFIVVFAAAHASSRCVRVSSPHVKRLLSKNMKSDALEWSGDNHHMLPRTNPPPPSTNPHTYKHAWTHAHTCTKQMIAPLLLRTICDCCSTKNVFVFVWWQSGPWNGC